MSSRKLRYSELAQFIDYDALYADLGWEPQSSHNQEDKGYCLMPGNHKSGDSTGKLAINRDKGVYNCWVCGGGTMLSLVMELKGLDEQDGIQYLSRFINAYQKESAEDFYARIARMIQDPEPEDKPLPHFNERVLDRFEDGMEYYSRRHISEPVAKFFDCKYSPDHHKFHPKWGEHTGPALILPHYWYGKLVGWQERWMIGTPSWVGKYTNTTDFPRENTVWGLDFVRKQTKQPVIVESVLTALYLLSEGYPAIATFGSSVRPNQIKHLRIFQQGVILAHDNDNAGTKWCSDLREQLSRYVPIFEVPPVPGSGSDLGDLDPVELSVQLRGVKPSFAVA